VERTVATRTEVIALSGRIDRLDRRPAGPGAGLATELAVVDYKTGRRPLTTDDARSSLALALYALAAGRVLRQPCYRVELHQVTLGTVIGWTHTPESLQRHLSRAEDIAEECAAADASYRAGPAGLDRVFPPQTGPACGWCDFRAHCPEGQAAADQRRPWDGLADEFTRPDPARPAPPLPAPPAPSPSGPAPARPEDAADAPPAGS
jgi:RecB family exonuclease